MNLSTLAATQKECAKLREERDALRTLLAAALAHMLGAGDGYENEVVMAISAALESNTKT